MLSFMCIQMIILFNIHGVHRNCFHFVSPSSAKPKLSLSWLAELALFSFNPATRPSGIVVKKVQISLTSHKTIVGQLIESNLLQ